MKTNTIQYLLLVTFFAFAVGACTKENTSAENEKNIKKLWKLDAYFVNSVDKTGSLTVSAYSESYTDNQKYDRTCNDKNGNKIVQNGTWKFESANRLHVSGVGSIEFTNDGTVSSSYYDVLKLTDTEFWYAFSNGGKKHEFRLSRK